MVLIDCQDEIFHFLGDHQPLELSVSRLDWPTFEFANGLEDELLFLHAEGFESYGKQVLSKLLGHRALAFFAKEAAQLENIPQELLSKGLIIVVSGDDPVKACRQLTIADSLLVERLTLKSQLFTIEKELLETLTDVSGELKRVKSIYDQKADKKVRKLKGLDLVSKYAAGESVGGEFFDFIEKGNNILILMSNANSYLASSLVLQECVDFREKSELTEQLLDTFLRNLQKKLRALKQNRVKKTHVAILAGIFDLNERIFRGIQCGGYQFLSSISDQRPFAIGKDKNFIDSELEGLKFQLELSQAERAFLLSPGLVKTWEKSSPSTMIESLLANPKLKLTEILDEVFFQMKKEEKGRFLSHDASAILMEAKGHAIYKV